MFVLRPIAVAMGACMLQACMTPPHIRDESTVSAPTSSPATVAETTKIAVQPVMRVSHSANQSAATFYQLGKYHVERGNLDFARSAYEASITLDGQQLDARNALAALDATQGKLDSSKALLIQIVADFPEVAHPYNNLGYVYYLQSNFEAAERTLQKAIALDAGNERARNNLNAVNMALARLGNSDTAVLAQPMLPEQPMVQSSEPVTTTVETAATAVTETRTQGLAIISPPLEQVAERVEPQARMEVVQIVPNIFELRLRQDAPTVLADLKNAKPEPVSAVSDVLTATVLPSVSAPVTPTKASRIEVANGNGVTGMAKRISNVLGRQGISVSRLSNERPYKQLETKIQYRAGYEKAATNLKNALKGHAVTVLTPTLSTNSDVRLVLGKDAITHMALLENMSIDTVLALNTLID
jgi:tetratricopeptide (TPR) repeat protein